ncbi:Ubiquinone/menaquinone biosynthesis C-methylase UbiE [Desulfatibacillum alkenivorans DSM 16219]|jgi:ubiquinone/menaquinone biosynthesis C-methylase UbiE|uniref:Ubiquinone/menaquinone biosynthesis C-methylase UbiE n=1 Tax=Desulfatibacillum alkenivorans DSM 16219 TaxID=1121393 RepID=A0A1M6WZ01_9BACT|nr:Ubiquinone/menaquinone biosynthesis C-methylase UbiE [Desulfatibacillum alkenivorans DSM 16219]
MGYVFEHQDAASYDDWLFDPSRRAAAQLEMRLMTRMLGKGQGRRLLDIGCGTGWSLELFLRQGFNCTGLDPSIPMLEKARERLGNRVDLHPGLGESLDFDDNSFDVASLVTTLEFVENPRACLEEACRVAKDQLFVGFLNRYAIKGLQRRLKGLFSSTVYNKAQFFSVWEMKSLIRSVAGEAPIRWRTTCQLPGVYGQRSMQLEQSPIIQRAPTGAFCGMIVVLNPKFRTRPLPLRVEPSRKEKLLACYRDYPGVCNHEGISFPTHGELQG